MLNSFGINYVVDPKLVRGLDYYTDLVFEFVDDDIMDDREVDIKTDIFDKHIWWFRDDD